MSSVDAIKTLHLVIQGRVQGVFFRDSMRREACRLGVSGWVRNLPGGSVEACVQGGVAAVDAIVAWAHRGPPQANVERVEITLGQGSFSSFEILY